MNHAPRFLALLSVFAFFLGTPFAAALAPVTILPATNVTSTSATLNWVSLPEATYGFDIYVGTDPTVTQNLKYFWANAGSTSQAVSPFTVGITYYFRIRAYAPGQWSDSFGSFTTVSAVSQTIDFPQPGAKTFGDAPFSLSATASSGLPVSFQVVSGPGTLNSGTLTLTGGGDVVVRATQAGNSQYLAAAAVDRTITVSPGAQTITFATLPDYEANPLAYYSLPATSSSGLPISFTVDAGSATVTDGMLQVTGTGLVRLTATQAGNVDFLAASPVTREFTAVAATPAARMKITKFGILSGSSTIPSVFAISGDATTIVGVANNSSDDREAFRSTLTGSTGLGDFSGGMFSSEARAVSADGSVVVGYGTSSAGNEAFRWTESGMVSIGDLPGGSASSIAYGVSADGTVVVGYGQNSSFFNEAFRWTQAGGMTGLGFLPGGQYSTAYAISADGQTIVGGGQNTGAVEMAFRWTSGSGMSPLGDLTGGQIRSNARAVSADGSVVVGQSTSARGREAFRWTAAGGMQPLGDLPGGLFQSDAIAVSADGSVIVGSASTASSSVGFVWDDVRGMRSLAALLSAAGIATNVSLTTVTGISADGRFVSGSGWVLDLDAPPPPAPTVALLWTEDLPQPGPGQGACVLRIADENGEDRLDIATHIGSTIGGFNGVEYANGRILVPNQGFGGGGIRTHHPDFSPILVTNVFAYDLDEQPGQLWNTNGSGQTITRSQPSASPVISGGLYDYSYTPLGSTNTGHFTSAIQTVGSTVYFSSPTVNPIGLYKMNTDGTGITGVLTASDASAPVIYDFKVVGNFIYFGNINNSTIQRVNTDGSGLVTLVSGATFPNGIDVTDTAIYWTELFNGVIRRSDLSGGNATELVAGLTSPRGVAAAPLSLLPVTDLLADFLSDAGVSVDLRGPNDDADSDGLDNLLEYALDLNPNGTGGAFTGSLPASNTTPTLLQFTYRRVRNDVTYTVQTSPTLSGGTWTSVGVTQGTPGPDGTTIASIPVTPGSAFLRLVVTR